MKLTTVTIPAVEMTRKESNSLWNTSLNERFINGIKVKDWNTDDGNNDILLEGETAYRVVAIIE